MNLPNTPLFVMTNEKPGTVVPCFNYSEAALLDWYFREIGLRTEALSRLGVTIKNIKFSVKPELIQQAALRYYGNKVGRVKSRVTGKSRYYCAAGTARKILRPLSGMRLNTAEIIREEIRRGVQR